MSGLRTGIPSVIGQVRTCSFTQATHVGLGVKEKEICMDQHTSDMIHDLGVITVAHVLAGRLQSLFDGGELSDDSQYGIILARMISESKTLLDTLVSNPEAMKRFYEGGLRGLKQGLQKLKEDYDSDTPIDFDILEKLLED